MLNAFKAHKQPPLWELVLSTQILITKEVYFLLGMTQVIRMRQGQFILPDQARQQPALVMVEQHNADKPLLCY